MARESKRTRDERRFGKLERLADKAIQGKWHMPIWDRVLAAARERLASRTERPADTAPIRKLLEAKRSP
jgi:hypothetical protein